MERTEGVTYLIDRVNCEDVTEWFWILFGRGLAGDFNGAEQDGLEENDYNNYLNPIPSKDFC